MSGYAIKPAAYAAKPVCCYLYQTPFLTHCALSRLQQTSTSRSDHNITQILTPHYSVNKEIVVRLKWGNTEYRGVLVSIDSYMNIQLTNTQEYIDQKMTATLGQVLIRCNNVLWIQGAPMDGGEQQKVDMSEVKKDVDMEG